jgi:histidinol-phosphate aminotransferase
VFGDGSEDLIKILCEVFLAPGDLVVTQRPVFGLHEIYPKMMGAEVELLELNEELGFDLGAWCAAVAKAPKIAFLPNPSNPVGCMMDGAVCAGAGGHARQHRAGGGRGLLRIRAA